MYISCTRGGRVSVPLLLASVARGGEGMLVLGRNQHTCRLDGAEDPARARVRQARRALELAGLGSERVRFEVPEPGRDGPARSLGRFVNAIGPAPLAEKAPDELFEREGLDASLEVLG